MRTARIPATGGAMSTIDGQDSILGNLDAETSRATEGISGTTNPCAPDGSGSGSSKEPQAMSPASFMEKIMNQYVSRRSLVTTAAALTTSAMTMEAAAEKLSDVHWENVEAAQIAPDADLLALGQQLDAELALARDYEVERHRLYDATMEMLGPNYRKNLHDNDLFEKAARSSGLWKISDIEGRCHKRIDTCVKRIKKIQATTISGFSVKATALMWDMFLWEGLDTDNYNIKIFHSFISEMRNVAVAA